MDVFIKCRSCHKQFHLTVRQMGYEKIEVYFKGDMIGKVVPELCGDCDPEDTPKTIHRSSPKA